MRDRISLMLDSMITVVEEGFSTDGIVSIPETGLEDVRYPVTVSLVDWLDDRVEQLRVAISKAKTRVFGKPTPPVDPSPTEPKSDRPDSGIGSGDKPDTPEVPPNPPDSPSPPDPSDSQGSIPLQEHPQDDGNGNNTQTQHRPSSRERMPRKRGQGSKGSRDSDAGENPPRKNTVHEKDKEGGQIQPLPATRESAPRLLRRQVPDDSASPNVEPSLPMTGLAAVVAPPTASDQRLTRKDTEPQPPASVGSKSPRKRKEEAILRPESNQGRQPRKKDGDEEGAGGGSGRSI